VLGSHAIATRSRNVPYTIAGDAVADHLSFLYASRTAIDACE
jgi:hypothetical protein